MNDSLPKLYLIRHGETAWSISGQHTGRTDIALTEQGARDAQALSARLSGINLAAVWSSPLQRAWRTAELAGFAARVHADADLTEWNYGDYEGRRTPDIRAERPGWRLFEDGCPGGETLAEVSSRADRVLTRIRAVQGNVLVFSHRDILRVLIVRWLALPALEGRRFYLATASSSVLGYDHSADEPVIQQLNETPRNP